MGWCRSSLLVLLLLSSGCPRGRLGGFVSPPADGTEIRCPVTQVRCAKGPATEAAVFEMRTFYFCTAEARTEFAETPKKYAYQ